MSQKTFSWASALCVPPEHILYIYLQHIFLRVTSNGIKNYDGIGDKEISLTEHFCFLFLHTHTGSSQIHLDSTENKSDCDFITLPVDT